MRAIKMSQIKKNIEDNRMKVNTTLAKERAHIPRVKRARTRSVDERIALTEIAIACVNHAKLEGKMKMVGKRRMYYDASE